ncbi:MAG: hypothetical protein JWP25_8260 [Bradyrhizobium sp.]|nr:hypothetical protein [Bradyrhizobium sp.]
MSWSGGLFAYYARPADLAVESNVPPDSADVDVRLWAKGTPNNDIPQFYANAFTVNRGKFSANNFNHSGLIALGGAIQNTFVDALFLTLRKQLKLLPVPVNSVIRVGQDTIWFTIPGPPVSDDLSKALADGTQLMFVFNVMRYQDDRTPPGKYIYSENCIYFAKEVAHLCEAGHNRNYISD